MTINTVIEKPDVMGPPMAMEEVASFVPPMFRRLPKPVVEHLFAPDKVIDKKPSMFDFYRKLNRFMAGTTAGKFEPLIKTLPAVDARLRIDPDKGYVVVPPPVLERQINNLVGRCQWLIANNLTVPSRPGKKTFMEDLISDYHIAHYPEFLDFALEPAVLSAVADYLGCMPILQLIRIWKSSNTGGTQWTSSQLYHCDHADTRQVKIFVYLTDTDASHGPLTVIPARESARLRAVVGYRWKQRVKDEELLPLLKEKEVAFTGKAGTTAMVDTCANFHYGSRVSAPTSRTVVVFQYLSQENFLMSPIPALRRYTYAHLVSSSHSPVQRAVLCGSAR